MKKESNLKPLIYGNGVISTAFILFLYLNYANGYGRQEQLWFEILHPSPVAYLYKILPARDFGGVITWPLKNVKMVVADPPDACSSTMKNDLSLRGSIVLAERGLCSFVSKAINIDKYNPSSIIIFNDKPDDIDEWIEMSSDGTNRDGDIIAPVFYLLGKDGYKIKHELTEKGKKNFGVANLPINVTSISVEVRSHQPPWDYV